MRKRFLSLFIGLALVLSFSTAVPCFAGTDETTIDGITYQYDTDTGKATVIGYEDGISINAEIKGIITVGGEGYDVKFIGDRAFQYCTGLESITIPEGVTSIGDYAFVYCTALTDVYAPKDLDFGNDTFSYANQNLKVWRYEVLKSAEMSEDEKTHVKIVAVEDRDGKEITDRLVIQRDAMGDGYVIDEVTPENLFLKHIHTLAFTDAKEPTCTEVGNKACWYCETCVKYFRDEDGTEELDYQEDVVIPATGHNWGEPEWNWSEDGKNCTVTFTCQNDASHKATPEVSISPAEKTPATCTKNGVTAYTATVEFNGDEYTKTKEVEDIPATGHSYENGKCTVCGAIDPDFKAVIIEGANGVWQKGTKDGLSFTSNAAFADFQKVQVDSNDLDASNYTVKEGSTVVTLNASYLETLSVGKHTLSVVSETGTASTEFTITAAASSDVDRSSETGDGSYMLLWMILLFISGAVLSAVMWNRRQMNR